MYCENNSRPMNAYLYYSCSYTYISLALFSDLIIRNAVTRDVAQDFTKPVDLLHPLCGMLG